jgi:hypothetical protein
VIGQPAEAQHLLMYQSWSLSGNTRFVSHRKPVFVNATHLAPISLSSGFPLPLPIHGRVVLSQVSTTGFCFYDNQRPAPYPLMVVQM